MTWFFFLLRHNTTVQCLMIQVWLKMILLNIKRLIHIILVCDFSVIKWLDNS